MTSQCQQCRQLQALSLANVIPCRKVLATEVAKSGVASAHENLKANAITNAFVARLSSEEFTSAWKKERVFSRLQVRNVIASSVMF